MSTSSSYVSVAACQFQCARVAAVVVFASLCVEKQRHATMICDTGLWTFVAQELWIGSSLSIRDSAAFRIGLSASEWLNIGTGTCSLNFLNTFGEVTCRLDAGVPLYGALASRVRFRESKSVPGDRKVVILRYLEVLVFFIQCLIWQKTSQGHRWLYVQEFISD